MNRVMKGAFIPLVASLVMVLAGCVPPAVAKEIRIGIIGPMAFIQGEHHWFGATLAADEINAQGGILVGDDLYQITLVQADSNEMLSVTDAATAMERVITVDQVDFVVGGFRTEAVFAMQDVAMDYEKIFLGAGAATPELNTRVADDYDRYKYWFRVTPINSTYLGAIDFQILGMVAAKIGALPAAPKVAILAEAAVWADPIVAAAEALLPTLGMEVVGTWRPSPTATEVTAELAAIEAAGANIIFTSISGPLGIVYARQWGELEIPAASAGINVEAQKQGFWDATGGFGNYEMTLNVYAGPQIEITDETIPFFDKFVDRFGEFPTYNAGTYEALYVLKDAIERAGTLDSDAVVVELENTDRTGPAGRIVFMGRDTETPHDVTWGPGYVTGISTQWQDGELKAVWPPPGGEWEGVVYEGTVDYVLPPWVVEAWGP